MLVTEFLKLRKTVDFRSAQIESIELSNTNHQIALNEVSNIKEQINKEFKKEVKNDFQDKLEEKTEERENKALKYEHESSHNQVSRYTNLFKYVFVKFI